MTASLRDAIMDDLNITDTAHRDAFAQGFADGVESPDDLSMGMTYEDERDGIYDSGVNFGQAYGLHARA